MRIIVLRSALVLMFVMVCGVTYGHALSTQEIVEQTEHSVLKIRTVGDLPGAAAPPSDLPQDCQVPYRGNGSGFVIKKQKPPQDSLNLLSRAEHGPSESLMEDVYILTNYHVASPCAQTPLKVDLKVDVITEAGSRSTYDAQWIGGDPLSDLAVIKISYLDFLGESLQPVRWAGANDPWPKKGLPVIALGFPLGRDVEGGITVTRGIVSAVNRRVGDTYSALVQTDASINAGNSGGPLLDQDGRVIGVNTLSLSKLQQAGISWAISSRVAIPVMEQLLAKGRVDRGDLKLALLALPQSWIEEMDNARLPRINGLLVTRDQDPPVQPGQQLRQCDIVTSVGGYKVETTADLNNALLWVGRQPSVRVDFVRYRPETCKRLIDAVAQLNAGKTPARSSQPLVDIPLKFMSASIPLSFQ